MIHTDAQAQSFIASFFDLWPFCHVPKTLHPQLSSKLRLCSFAPGDVIYPARELPSEVHAIVQGQVRILGPTAYQSPTLAIASKGTVIGWNRLLRRLATGSVRAAFSIASEKGTAAKGTAAKGTAAKAITPAAQVLTLALPADEFEALALQHLMPALTQRLSLIELFDTLSCFLSAMPSYFSGVNLKEIVRYIEQEQLAVIETWYPDSSKADEILFQLSDDRVWLVSGGAVLNVPVGTPVTLPQGLHLVQPSPFPVRLLGIDRSFLASAILSGAVPESSPVESTVDLRLLPSASSHIGVENTDLENTGLKNTDLENTSLEIAPEIGSLEAHLAATIAKPIPSKRQLPVKSYPIRQSPSPTLVEDIVACFDMVCQVLQVPYRPDALRRQLSQRSLEDFDPLELCVRIAQALGLEAHIVRFTPTIGGLNRLDTPAIVQCRGILSVFHESTTHTAVLGSPRAGLLRLSAAELPDRLAAQAAGSKDISTCHAVVLERLPQTPVKQFGFRWFLPILAKQRGILIQVFLASAFVQVLGLANPLLIQQVIDKVIINANAGAMPTFGVLLVTLAFLEGILTILRTYLFSSTTLRLDLRLGTEIVRHLLRLPLNFFEKRPVGELSARLSELEKIRQFLTGTALTAVLDVVFSLMYVGVMLLYSVNLTICVLLALPVIMLSTVIVASIQQRLIRVRSDHGAKVQSYLIEVLGGMFTVKAQHLENLAESTWRDRYVKYLTSGFTNSTVSTIYGSFSQFLNTISGFLVLWFGASLVLDGQLTLGGLIAFRILSGSVTGPFIRLSRLWQQVQETSLSLELLADIVEFPIEASPQQDEAHVRLPDIAGRVQYRNVCFGFKPGQQQLSNLNLDIPAAAFVGVVGQSGSGKSTLVKLLPRLYSPQSGTICIDGFDISKVKLSSLRQQIGYVPQDPALFDGTIRDNITLFQPLDDDAVMIAAQVAEAHDFIMQLPEGYNTPVGERGGALSGGQRQRIAIARIIASNPRLVIFDEATSALDYETERKVCMNLRTYLRDRTVFFITHRLNTITQADWILYLQSGILAEQGTHADLMAQQQLYYSLFSQALRL